MTLPNWDALPVRTKRSRKRLYTLIASELSLTAWKSLPNNVKRSKIHLYNYIASQKNLEEYDELAKNNMRSTRLLYTYIKENASGSKPTLTIKVKDGETNVSGATVTIGTTEKTTDASGETTYSLDYDNYTVEVEKTYYEDYTENIKFRANHKTFTIPLEPTLYKVTVTAKDGSANALSNATVNIKQSTNVLATGKTGTDGKVELSVRAGTFTLEAESSDKSLSYSGSLTVDGEETETITLIAQTGVVAITCQDGVYTVIEGADVYLYTGNTKPSAQDDSMVVAYGETDGSGIADIYIYDTSSHQATEDYDILYGTYNLYAVKGSLEYEGTLTVNDEEITKTITLTGGDS